MINGNDKPMIEARNLSKYFGEFVAIKDISFSIPKGQIVAFLGPNGAGKTTTMRLLTGFMRPSQGSAFICGHEVSGNRLGASRFLGYLPENGPLYENMTPLELLRFFGEVREMEEKYLSQRIDTLVDRCALQTVLEKPIGKLSRGYRQRVGLAQVLLHDPDVLIMDEPTAGLDPNQIRDFRDNISELANTKTILLSTHILQEVEAVAARVLLVHNGRLVFDGSPGDLRKQNSMEESFYKMTNYGRSSELNTEGGML
ncbi:MAG: ABC transporter ATP-binding protein [candidate division Zixibacteria bacterium]